MTSTLVVVAALTAACAQSGPGQGMPARYWLEVVDDGERYAAERILPATSAALQLVQVWTRQSVPRPHGRYQDVVARVSGVSGGQVLGWSIGGGRTGGGEPPDLWVVPVQQDDFDDDRVIGVPAPAAPAFDLWLRTSRYDVGPPPTSPDEAPALNAMAWALARLGGATADETLSSSIVERPTGTGSTWTWEAALARPRRRPASHVGITLTTDHWYEADLEDGKGILLCDEASLGSVLRTCVPWTEAIAAGSVECRDLTGALISCAQGGRLAVPLLRVTPAEGEAGRSGFVDEYDGARRWWAELVELPGPAAGRSRTLSLELHPGERYLAEARAPGSAGTLVRLGDDGAPAESLSWRAAGERGLVRCYVETSGRAQEPAPCWRDALEIAPRVQVQPAL